MVSFTRYFTVTDVIMLSYFQVLMPCMTSSVTVLQAFFFFFFLSELHSTASRESMCSGTGGLTDWNCECATKWRERERERECVCVCVCVKRQSEKCHIYIQLGLLSENVRE